MSHEVAGPSSGWSAHGPIPEESRYSESSKLLLKDAIVYNESLLDENNLISSESSENKALLMGKELYKNTLEMLDEKPLVIKEEHIDMNEMREEEICFKESEDDDSSEEYEPEQEKSKTRKHIPLEYKIKVIEIAKANPKWSLKTLQRKGCRQLKRKGLLLLWEDEVKNGGNIYDKYSAIDSWTYDRFVEARQNNQQVTTKNLQQWALDAAAQYTDLNFKVSDSWLTKFKRKHRISQRKVMKSVSQKESVSIQETLAAAESKETVNLISNFEEKYIIDTDQTGYQYQLTYNRMLDEKGAKIMDESTASESTGEATDSKVKKELELSGDFKVSSPISSIDESNKTQEELKEVEEVPVEEMKKQSDNKMNDESSINVVEKLDDSNKVSSEKLEDQSSGEVNEQSNEKMVKHSNEKLIEQSSEKMDEQSNEKIEDHEKIDELLSVKNGEEYSENIDKGSGENIDEMPVEKIDELLSDKVSEESSENLDEGSSKNIIEMSIDKIDKESDKNIDEESSENIVKESNKNIDGESSEKIVKEPNKNIDEESSGKVDKESNKNIDEELSETIDKESNKNIDEESSEKIDEESSEKIDEESSEKIDENSCEKINELNEKYNKQSNEKIDEQSSEKLNEPLSEKLNEPLSEKIDEQPSEKIDEQSSEKLSEPLSEKVKELSSEAVGEQPNKEMEKDSSEKMEKPPSKKMKIQSSEEIEEKISDKMDEQSNEKMDEQSNDIIDEDSSDKICELASKKMDDRLNEIMNDQSNERMDDQSNERMDDQSNEKMDDQLSERMDEQSDEKNNEQSSEKMDEDPCEIVDEEPYEIVDEEPCEIVDDEPCKIIDEHLSEKIDEHPSKKADEQSSGKMDEMPNNIKEDILASSPTIPNSGSSKVDEQSTEIKEVPTSAIATTESKEIDDMSDDIIIVSPPSSPSKEKEEPKEYVTLQNVVVTSKNEQGVSFAEQNHIPKEKSENSDDNKENENATNEEPMEIVRDEECLPAKMMIKGLEDDDEECSVMTVQEAQDYVLRKVESYIRDPSVNPILILNEQIKKRQEEVKAKGEELSKLNRMFDNLYKDHVRFLRHVGSLPKIETKNQSVSVDLPWIKPATIFPNDGNPVHTPLKPKTSNEPVECIDLTDDVDIPKPSTSSTPDIKNPALSILRKSILARIEREKEGKEREEITSKRLKLEHNLELAKNRAQSQPQAASSLPIVYASKSLPNQHPAPLPAVPILQMSNDIPKPRLKISIDKNGIVLQWDMPSLSKRVNITGYEISGYQEKSNLPVSNALWKKIGTVSPMALPMSCTLTQFVENFKYHFVIRAVSNDKFGPYSIPSSIMYAEKKKELNH